MKNPIAKFYIKYGYKAFPNKLKNEEALKLLQGYFDILTLDVQKHLLEDKLCLVAILHWFD